MAKGSEVMDEFLNCLLAIILIALLSLAGVAVYNMATDDVRHAIVLEACAEVPGRDFEGCRIRAYMMYDRADRNAGE